MVEVIEDHVRLVTLDRAVLQSAGLAQSTPYLIISWLMRIAEALGVENDNDAV